MTIRREVPALLTCSRATVAHRALTHWGRAKLFLQRKQLSSLQRSDLSRFVALGGYVLPSVGYNEWCCVRRHSS